MLFQIQRLNNIKLNGKIIMNNEWVRVWKEAVVAYLKVLFLYLHEGTEKNHEKLQSR
jgi:hypothetical protein